MATWRFVAGAFLHFGTVSGFVVVPVACLLLAPAGAGAEQIVQLALRTCAVFLVALLAVAGAATLLAAIVEPLLHRRGRARDDGPSVESRRRLNRAVETARRALDPATAARIERIAGAAWDHDDPAFQALSRDLDHLVASTAAALATAPIERRRGLVDAAATATGRLGDELTALNTERAQADEARAQAAALYVERRYGPSGLAIPPD